MTPSWKIWIGALAAGLLAWGADAHGQTLLNFTQAGCVPCEQQEPTLATLRADGLNVQSIDFVNDKNSVARYRVKATPTLIMLGVDGREIRRIEGVAPELTLRQWFAETRRAQATGSPSVQQPHPSIPRIQAPGTDSTSYGSGVLVAPDVVLTNWHVVNELVGNPIVYFPGQPPLTGQVIKTDQTWDLAAIRVAQNGALPVPIAASDAVRGDALTIIGYGSGSYRAAGGYCSGPLAPRDGLPLEMFRVNTAARNGDSGGPILNARGELAGVLWGANERFDSTSGTSRTRVCRFLFGNGQKPAPVGPSTIAPPVVGPSLVPVTPAVPAPVAPVAPTIPQDILNRIVALEQQVAANPGLLANLQADFQSQLAAVKANLADPTKLAALEANVQNVVTQLGTLQNAPGLLGQIGAVASSWIPTLAGGGVALTGVGLPAAVGFVVLRWLWGKFTGGSTATPATGTATASTPSPVAAPAAAPVNAGLPNLAPQLAALNAAISGLTAAANQAAANQAATSAAPVSQPVAAPVTQVNQPAPIVLPQVTNNITKPVNVQTVTNRQRALEQAMPMVAQSFPGSSGVISQIEAVAQQLESGMGQLQPSN